MKLRELLKEKDIHGAQLARKVGVERCTVSRWERGEMLPNMKLLKPIAKALDITTDELIDILLEK